MSQSVKFTITADRREKIDRLIRKALKEAGLDVKVSNLVPLDRRHLNTKNCAGYERWCDVKSGRTIFVGLTHPEAPTVSVREKRDARAQAKAEKKLARLEARNARQAAKVKP